MGMLLRNAATAAIATRTWQHKVKSPEGNWLVAKEEPLPAAGRYLLVVLADRIDDAHGTLWAGDEEIAEWVSYKEAWVRKWRQPLLDMALLEMLAPARRGVRARWRLFPELDWPQITPFVIQTRRIGRTLRTDMFATRIDPMAARPITDDRTEHRDRTEAQLDSPDSPIGSDLRASRVSNGGERQFRPGTTVDDLLQAKSIEQRQVS